MRSTATFVTGLVLLLLSFVMICCFWPIAIVLFIAGVVLMIVGGRPAPPQPAPYYPQAYYPPPGQQPYPPRALGASPPQPQSYPQQPPGVYGQPPSHPDEGWRRGAGSS